jgi:hypothetical protein
MPAGQGDCLGLCQIIGNQNNIHLIPSVNILP